MVPIYLWFRYIGSDIWVFPAEYLLRLGRGVARRVGAVQLPLPRAAAAAQGPVLLRRQRVPDRAGRAGHRVQCLVLAPVCAEQVERGV